MKSGKSVAKLRTPPQTLDRNFRAESSGVDVAAVHLRFAWLKLRRE